MADLRIVDAPVLLKESITDDVKMPTGGLGNYAIRLGDLVWYVVAKENLASKSYVDNSSKGVKDELDGHISDKNNPHKVTEGQVGLGNVDNTADIDKPVSNAVNSAIITATTDMATKTYVNQKDNLKADKATTLSGYGITDAYTKAETYSRTEIDNAMSPKADKSYVDNKDGDLTTLATTDKTNLVKAINEVHNNTEGVVALYDKNVATGNGENGWDDTLIAVSENVNQRQINDGLDSVAAMLAIKNPHNGQRVYVKSYYADLNKGGGTFVYDSTKSTINDGGVVINGWVRQLNSNEIDPVCFGAKAGFTRDKMDNTFDDAPAVQKTVNYLASIGGGTVVFGSGKYWINSYQRAETSDPINVIDMQSDVSFKWENGSQFIIGNYFDDKPFHIFSGLIKDAPVMRNIHFINPYITSIIENNYLKTRYVRRVIAEFRQCENVSVTGGIIRDVDTTNVLAFGSDDKTSFGATVENVKFLNVVYGGLNSANEDHTTVYLNAEDSKVTNCTFSNINGEKGWRIACPCELHASNTTFSNSKVSGYTRGGWFVAAEHEYTTNQCIENITAVIANAGIYVWCEKDTTLDTCVARNNTFICTHPINTDTPLYFGGQGLFASSGYGEGGNVQNMVFENNTVIYKHATKPEYQAAFIRGKQNYINFTIRDNKFIGCSAGIRGGSGEILDNYKNWDITNNVFEVDTLADSAKDAYLLFDSKSDLYQFIFDNNVFKFKTTAPNYICKLTAEASSLNYLGECIVTLNAPTIADYTYPNNMASDYHNIIHNTFYGLTFNVPAIDVGKYVVVPPTVQPNIAIPYRSTASFIGAWQAEVSVESDVRVTTGNIKAIIKNATFDNTQSPQKEIGGVICKVVGYA